MSNSNSNHLETQQKRQIRHSPALKTAIMGVMTALETIATMLLPITIPGTQGYFNVGEAFIYFTAIIFGPLIGAFVGGVGAALADLLLGYAVYAPGTLVIKGCEGFIVGSIFRVLRKFEQKGKQWKAATVIIGLGIGLLMIILGWNNLFFLILGIILSVLIILIGLYVKQETVIKVIAMSCGGVIMVLGYFSYEIALFGLDYALIGIPFNSLQVLLGILIAVPLITALESSLKRYFDAL